jgi:hypothetical protein
VAVSAAYREARWETWRWRATAPSSAARRVGEQTLAQIVRLPSGRIEIREAGRGTSGDLLERLRDVIEQLGEQP